LWGDPAGYDILNGGLALSGQAKFRRDESLN
jgi:hypothetical protein